MIFYEFAKSNAGHSSQLKCKRSDIIPSKSRENFNSFGSHAKKIYWNIIQNGSKSCLLHSDACMSLEWYEIFNWTHKCTK